MKGPKSLMGVTLKIFHYSKGTLTMASSVYKMNVLDPKSKGLTTDYLILAGGSDSRAYQILRRLRKKEDSNCKVILFDFEERTKNIDQSNPYFDYKKCEFAVTEFISCSIMNPSTSIDGLAKAFADYKPSKRISIDISCFTKPFFFFLIKFFKEKHNVPFFEIFYTEPETYIFPKGLFHSYHSSSGPLTVKEIPGFTGSELRSDKRMLVILLGFDGDLSQEINEDVSPSTTILVNGFPGYSPKFKDISLVINEKLTSNKDIKLHYARANSPFEVYNLLDKIRIENPKSFLNIAPLGTKPMALGACLFAIHNPSVRIVYPVPESYEQVTTRNFLHSWRYEIPVG